MRNLLVLFSFLFIFSCANLKVVDVVLKKQLDEIMHRDQTLRELFDTKTSENRKAEILSEFNISQEQFKMQNWNIVVKEDSLNLKTIENIISKYGYPGKTLVGVPTNETVWFVIQHSNKIEKYFPLIKTAGIRNEISDTLVAKMEDRLLMSKGKTQIYGTQGSGEMLMNKEKKQNEFFRYIWPIKEPHKVNQLRKKIGFLTTVEQNAKYLDIEYKIYTIEELAEKRKK